MFRVRQFRFFFISREEPRQHIHVVSPDGEAKFWIEPSVELAFQHGLADHVVAMVRKIVEARREEIHEHWARHFGR